MLVTKYQISAINSYWEKATKNILDGRKDGWKDGKTDRGKTVNQSMFIIVVLIMIANHQFKLSYFFSSWKKEKDKRPSPYSWKKSIGLLKLFLFWPNILFSNILNSLDICYEKFVI